MPVILKEEKVAKKTIIGLCAFLFIFLISFSDNNARILQEKEIELQIKELREKIQELAVKIEMNPEAEEADKWRDQHRKYINELERLLATSRAETQEKQSQELEMAIKRAEGQLKELELYIEDLRKKKAGEEKIHEVEERIVQKRRELAEYKILLERRQRGVDEPSAYQRERGELTAVVISSTEDDVTVRLKDSGRVMVLRVRRWRRVEGQRVENREEMDFVDGLKKGELIWANYIEGEERGTFFILEIKRVDK